MIPEHWVVPTVIAEHPPCACWAHRDPVPPLDGREEVERASREDDEKVSTFVLVAIALTVALAAAGNAYAICALLASNA